MENKKKFTEQEVYEISLDAFKQVHKVSYFLLHRALKSVLRRLPEECVMNSRNEIRTQNKKCVNCIVNSMGTFKT